MQTRLFDGYRVVGDDACNVGPSIRARRLPAADQPADHRVRMLGHGQRGLGPAAPEADLLASGHLSDARRSGDGQGTAWNRTIAEAGWRPSGGMRAAEIGPLPISSDTKYTAQYMEAIFTPGMTAAAHRHSGPEAWYTLTGETCLETPEGKLVGRAGGEYVIVPGGRPMHLTAIGTETRRSLVLVLHDSSQLPRSPAHDWTPKGLCRN